MKNTGASGIVYRSMILVFQYCKCTILAPKFSKGNKRIIHDCIYTMTFGFKTATLWNTITHNLVSFWIILVALKRAGDWKCRLVATLDRIRQYTSTFRNFVPNLPDKEEEKTHIMKQPAAILVLPVLYTILYTILVVTSIVHNTGITSILP
jgi:hypothetical protein